MHGSLLCKRIAQRRTEIIELIQRRFSTKENAALLNLREQTVRVYRSRIKTEEANAVSIRAAGVSVSVDPTTAGMLTEEAEQRGILCGQLIAELWLGRHDRGGIQLSDRLLARAIGRSTCRRSSGRCRVGRDHEATVMEQVLIGPPFVDYLLVGNQPDMPVLHRRPTKVWIERARRHA